LALKVEMLTVPSFETLFQQTKSVNVDALNKARKQVLTSLAKIFKDKWLRLYESKSSTSYAYEQQQVENRKASNLALKYLSLAGSNEAKSLINGQFERCDNMSDSLGALGAAQVGNLDLFEHLMHQFEQKWQADPLVLDKWFSLHANTQRPDILSRLTMLMSHNQFTINNPNRVRALIGSFAFYNVSGFHNIDGSGYKFVADYLIKLNNVNPQVAARIITPLIQWQKVDDIRQDLMQHQLMRIGNTKDLSKDLFEKISKSLP
jgi:aminopeptidase N